MNIDIDIDLFISYYYPHSESARPPATATAAVQRPSADPYWTQRPPDLGITRERTVRHNPIRSFRIRFRV